MIYSAFIPLYVYVMCLCNCCYPLGQRLNILDVHPFTYQTNRSLLGYIGYESVKTCMGKMEGSVVFVQLGVHKVFSFGIK